MFEENDDIKLKNKNLAKRESFTSSVDIPKVYQISNLHLFVRYFSLENLFKTTEKLSPIRNNLLIAVNTNQSLLNELDGDILLNSKDKKSINFVNSFISQLKLSNKNNLISNFQIFGFNNKIKNISSSKNLIEQLSLMSAANYSSCDLLKILSQIFNAITPDDPMLKKENNFLRFIIFTGKTNPVVSENLKNILNTFSQKFGVVINFLFLQKDYYFSKFSKNEINDYVDSKEGDDYVLKSSKTINYLWNMNENEELQIFNLNQDLLKFAKKLFFYEDPTYKNFDASLKTFLDLFDAINDNLYHLGRSQTRRDQLVNLRRNIEEVISKDMVAKSLQPLKSLTAEVSRNFRDANSQIRNFRDNLEKFDKNIKSNGK